MTLDTLRTRFTHAVVSWVQDDGYPVSVATDFEVRGEEVVLRRWEGVAPPGDREVAVTFSHIRPQPGVGYDERRYVNLWGRLRAQGDGLALRPERRWGWDESETPFFQYSEVTVPQARRYLGQLSARVGRTVRPKLAFGWLALRTTRLPFVTATIVPVLLGVAVAALDGVFRPGYAALTLLGAVLIHLGLNVANDVFDAASGADEANTTPTPFSGGSRVIQYGLVRFRTMALLAASFYLSGIGIGLWLAAQRGFWPLFWLGVAGVAVSLAYTAPPLRLVHRGLGEVAVAAGFGPIVVLGAYFVQAQRYAWEPFYVSLPLALLIALVLYVNEVPDRPGDARAGKRTLPVRLSKRAVLNGYSLAVGLTYALVVAGAVAGLIAFPAVLALLTVPLAVRVRRGLEEHYDSPYELMPVMQTNIQLHLFCGLLLFSGYLVAIAAEAWLSAPPFFLR